MTFASTGLSPALCQAAAALGWHTPTPVQQASIAPVVSGADVLAQAPTGSGKTAAYVLPLLQLWSQQARRPSAGTRLPVRCLVLVPTRELATQVGEVVRALLNRQAFRLKLAVVYGGVSINPQMMALRGGADWVVATPGRLLDLVAHHALSLQDVQHLVLDEADRLLDAGFAQQWASVQALLPVRRQSLLFSATFPEAVHQLAQSGLHNPVNVQVDSTPDQRPNVVQRALQVDATRRTALLRHLIEGGQWRRVLVFVATRHSAAHVADKLYKAGIYATHFHGDMSQGARQEVLQEFRDERWDVLVTTDLAARGIDIAQLRVVVNYDLPRSANDHVHRVGRTARAGASGLAVSFISTPAAEAHFRLIEKRQGLRVPREQLAGFEPTQSLEPTSSEAGGVKGKRPSKKDKLRAAAARPQ